MPIFEILLTTLMASFAVLLLVFQARRMSIMLKSSKKDEKGNFTRESKTEHWIWFAELFAVLGLLACIIAFFILSQNLISADSPGCLPYFSRFGVVASGVDPKTYFLTKDPVTYPALTYAEAIEKFQNSPDGLATGYFAWDGIAVTILNSNASHLADKGAPPGTSWVFEDLNTAVVRRQ